MAGARRRLWAGPWVLAIVLAGASDAWALPPVAAVEDAAVLSLQGGEEAGTATALVGDVDGDGIGDVAVTSPKHTPDAGRYEAGAVHVVSGLRRGRGDLDPALITILAPVSSRGVRLVVAGAGDVDGDGLGDVLVGVPDLRIDGVRRGAAYVVRGARAARMVDLQAFDGTQADGFRVLGTTYATGTDVAGIGDVDGDGLDDLAIGDPSTYQGSVSIVHGRPGGADVDLAGAPSGVLRVVPDWGVPIGGTVAAAGDVNGDGAPDVVAGGEPKEPGTTEGEIDPGGAYVIHGGPRTGTLTTREIENGVGGFAILGFYRAAGWLVDVGGAGDANGDGLGDVAVGLHGAGAAYVVFGRAATTPVRLAAFDGTQSAGYRVIGGGGGGIAPAGDQDGDGLDDLLVTSWEDGGSGDAPNAFVVPGQRTGAPVDLGTFDGLQARGSKITGLANLDSLDRATSGGLDATGDGCPDLLLGSKSLDRTDLVAGDCRPRAPITEPVTKLEDTASRAPAATPAVAATPPSTAPAAAPPRPRLAVRRHGARLVVTASCADRGALTVRWDRGTAVNRHVAGSRTARLKVPRRAERARLALRCGDVRLTRRLRGL